MAFPAFRAAIPKSPMGTSARLIKQNQVFRQPFNKKLGTTTGIVFVSVYILFLFLHGYAWGQPDAQSLETYQGATNFWKNAFIGEGPGGSRIDVIQNLLQFVYFFVTIPFGIPLEWVIIPLGIILPFLMGYQFARFLVDRAQNWVIGAALVTASAIFINGDFCHAVASGNALAFTSLAFVFLVIEMAIQFRTHQLKRRLYLLVTWFCVSNPLGVLVVLPLFYYYRKSLSNATNQKTINFILSYGLGLGILLWIFRLVYFGTLGFFDPITNFSWQISVHGIGYLWAGFTHSLYQMEDGYGLIILLLAVLSLFIDRQESLWFLGISVVGASLIQFLISMVLPMPKTEVTRFTWLVPIYCIVVTYLMMNPLPQFLKTWNVRLIVVSLVVFVFGGLTWKSKAKSVVRNAELSESFSEAILKLNINNPVAYGALPDYSSFGKVTWASYCRLEKQIRLSPGLFLDWFFEVAAPDILILRPEEDEQIRLDTRFRTQYSLFKKGNVGIPSIYLRTELLNKGEEYQLIKRIESVVDNEVEPSMVIPKIVKQEQHRFDAQGGVYHIQPLVRCFVRLATKLEWANCLREPANLMSEAEGSPLAKMLITASYTSRYEAEIINELTRHYFVAGFSPNLTSAESVKKAITDPIAALPQAPGFQDGKIKVFVTRNSLVVYLPNAGKVDTMSSFFLTINQFSGKGREEKVYKKFESFRISDNLVLLGPNDGYASFALAGQSNISSVDFGQKDSNNEKIWSSTFSINRVRRKDAF